MPRDVCDIVIPSFAFIVFTLFTASTTLWVSNTDYKDVGEWINNKDVFENINREERTITLNLLNLSIDTQSNDLITYSLTINKTIDCNSLLGYKLSNYSYNIKQNKFYKFYVNGYLYSDDDNITDDGRWFSIINHNMSTYQWIDGRTIDFTQYVPVEFKGIISNGEVRTLDIQLFNLNACVFEPMLEAAIEILGDEFSYIKYYNYIINRNIFYNTLAKMFVFMMIYIIFYFMVLCQLVLMIIEPSSSTGPFRFSCLLLVGTVFLEYIYIIFYDMDIDLRGQCSTYNMVLDELKIQNMILRKAHFDKLNVIQSLYIPYDQIDCEFVPQEYNTIYSIIIFICIPGSIYSIYRIIKNK